jgi:hypothetical protein
MAKSKIFIASSGRTLVLAEQLREQLRTDYCEAELWKDRSEGKPGDTIIEMLEGAAKEYDFAVIILSRDDVIVKETGDKLKARDNCIFEAGLFMAAIGRKRCFLVNSVSQGDLPSDLGGIIFLPFTEPSNLSDPTACKNAIMSPSTRIKSSVYDQRASPIIGRLLSQESLLAKARKTYEGGELFEGQVVVASIQPLELSYEAALQVRNNLDGNIRYVYFLPGDQDGAEKISQLLQLVLLARLLGSSEEAAHFESRRERVANNLPKIMEDLKQICLGESIKVCFLPARPDLQYCIHNATDDKNAKLYMKHGEAFIEWESGDEAYQFWNDVRTRQGIAEPDPPYAVFYGATGFNLRENVFLRTLKGKLGKYFPGIQEEVMKWCLEGHD